MNSKSLLVFNILLVLSLTLLTAHDQTSAIATEIKSVSADPSPLFRSGETSNAEINPSPPMAPGVVLVGLKPGITISTGRLGVQTSDPSLDAALASIGVQSVESLLTNGKRPPGETGPGSIYRLRLAPDVDILPIVQELKTNPAVAYAEPDYLAHVIVTPDDPLLPQQWGLSKIQAPAAWDVVTGTQTVVIAVIDSGIDLIHPDLASRLWINPGEIPDNGLDDDNNGYVDDVQGWNFVSGSNDVSDGNGHGTQVAGVAAAATDNGQGIAGVCWNCRIMPVRVMADSGISNYSDIALGVIYAADKGAQVINLSLGGYTYSNALRDAVDYAVGEGAVVVGGAGNDDVSTPFYPAAYESVLAVAATDATDGKATFSNYGTWVDLGAPGVAITTTFLGGDWGPANGTSLSTSFVSGLAALVRSHWPAWTPALVRNQLEQTADSLDALNPAYAGQLGAGRINAAAAMQEPHPVLTLEGTSVNGDSLGRPTPGEAATLAVTLRNAWADAAGVSGILATADPYVTLTSDTASYGDIPAGGTGTGSPVYSFTVASGAGWSHPILFTLAVTANGGAYTTTIPFTITTRSGDEHFCGTVAEDMVWTNDKTYILDCNVGIAPGYTLTIQAGTEVHFNGDYNLSVGGALIADGTAAQPIRFMPHTGGSWGRIFFDDPSVDARATVSGTYQGGNLLRHVRIEGAAQGIGCNNATPYLEQVTLTGGGMDCAGGNTALWVQESDLSGDVQIDAGSGVDSVWGVWTARAPMPTARTGLAAATAINGKLYAIGGWNGGNLATVEEYDPTTDTWITRAPMPTARVGLAAAVAPNGKIYAIGGAGEIATVEEYDPATDTWAARAPMPTARGYLAVAAAPNGKLYAFGGETDTPGEYLATVEEYDPATDTWTACASMPTARGHLAVTAAPNGKLYAIGGSGGGGSLATVEEYDPAADTWTARTPMPTARHFLATAAAPNGKLYAIGGYDNYDPTATVEEYDPATDTWTVRVPMPTARSWLAVAAAPNGKLYAIGGNNQDYLTTVEEFTPPTEEYGYHILRSTLGGNVSLPDYSIVRDTSIDGSLTIGGDLAEGSHNVVQDTIVAGDVTFEGTAAGAIADNMVNGAISLSNGVAQNNTVRSGSVSIGRGSVLTNTVWDGGISAGDGSTVRGNDVENAPIWGIQASGDVTVEYNRLVGCANGVQTSGGVVQGNLVANTASVGLEIGSVTAKDNTFTGVGGSAVKITSGTAVTLTGNNFEFNPGQYDVEDLVPKTILMTVNARDNWWGTTSGAAIQQRIFDFNDDYTIGTVLYSPVLTQPSTVAPAYVRAITLTPESPVGIQTVVFDVLFNREMDVDVAPQISFVPALDWIARTAMPTARRGLGVAAAPNGKLYAIGGYNEPQGLLATVEEYDPATDTWTARASMPTAREWLAVSTASNGKLYAIGGAGGGTAVEEYDPATDAWTTRAPMPTWREGLAVAAAPNGKLYAIGGFGSGGDLAAVEEYDPATDTWTARTPMPTACNYLAVAAAPNGKLYAIGGYNESQGVLATVEEYDPAADTWTARAPMPTARYGLAVATASNGKLYAIGGIGGGATVEEYDPATDTWTSRAPMPTARRYLAAAATPNGKLYAIGGHNDQQGYLATVEELTPWVAYTDFYGGHWLAPDLYRASYDFSTLVPRDTYTIIVAGARTPTTMGSGTLLLPVPGGGMEIAPNSATTFTVDYAGYINDTTPPPPPIVLACGATTPDRLSARWSAYDPESAITLYSYAIGVAPGTDQVVHWTTTPLTSTTRVGLSLLAGQTYYVSAKARNEGGLWSEPGVSSGVVAGSGECPTAGFTASPTSGFAPLTVHFTDTSTGTLTVHLWDLGDGATSAVQHPTHVYTATGAYTVSLDVYGPSGGDRLTRAGYVVVTSAASPTADFTASPTSGAPPLTVVFANTSTGDYTTSLWDLGDGVTSTLESPTHTYVTTGAYTVTLAVSGPGGADTLTRTNYIIVTQAGTPPVADFTASPLAGQPPLTVVFTDTSTGVVTAWSWNFGDGETSTAQHPTHTYTLCGTFTISLTVSGPSGSNTEVKVDYIQVSEKPIIANFTAQPTSGPAPLTVQFTDRSAGNITSWQWAFGDGVINTLPNPTHVYATAGTYTVTLTVSGPEGSDTETKARYITVQGGGSIYLPLILRND